MKKKVRRVNLHRLNTEPKVGKKLEVYVLFNVIFYEKQVFQNFVFIENRP